MADLSDWIQRMYDIQHAGPESFHHQRSDYIITDEIGSGSEYSVYKAKMKGSEKTYVIRILKDAVDLGCLKKETWKYSRNEDVLKKFCGEMEIWNQAFISCPDGVA